jgi:hypothetical protein
MVTIILKFILPRFLQMSGLLITRQALYHLSHSASPGLLITRHKKKAKFDTLFEKPNLEMPIQNDIIKTKKSNLYDILKFWLLINILM